MAPRDNPLRDAILVACRLALQPGEYHELSALEIVAGEALSVLFKLSVPLRDHLEPPLRTPKAWEAVTHWGTLSHLPPNERAAKAQVAREMLTQTAHNVAGNAKHPEHAPVAAALFCALRLLGSAVNGEDLQYADHLPQPLRSALRAVEIAADRCPPAERASYLPNTTVTDLVQGLHDVLAGARRTALEFSQRDSAKERGTVRIDGVTISLSPIEFELLQCMDELRSLCIGSNKMGELIGKDGASTRSTYSKLAEKLKTKIGRTILLQGKKQKRHTLYGPVWLEFPTSSS